MPTGRWYTRGLPGYAWIRRLQKNCATAAGEDGRSSDHAGDFRAAELSNEIAKLAVREFRDGSMKEAVKEFEGSVALAESELVRYEDRLDWVKRMKKKGYVPAAQVTSEEANHVAAYSSPERGKGAYQLYSKWMGPRTLRSLEVNILGTQATLDYQRSRLNRNLEQPCQAGEASRTVHDPGPP